MCLGERSDLVYGSLKVSRILGRLNACGEDAWGDMLARNVSERVVSINRQPMVSDLVRAYGNRSSRSIEWIVITERERENMFRCFVEHSRTRVSILSIDTGPFIQNLGLVLAVSLNERWLGELQPLDSACTR
jgi:hypothetical protein